VVKHNRRAGWLVSRERQECAERLAQDLLDGPDGQRWKVESVHSVIKRKYEEPTRSHLRWLRYREPNMKGLVYNLHR
jgi:hypothetical protein